MRPRCIISLLCLLCVTLTSRAQFYVGGNERASLRFDSVTGQYFQVIYPRGLDTLARRYLDALEGCRGAVSAGVGMTSVQFPQKPLQVLLHTQNPNSNGSVTWTPSRMELLTVPQWNNPSALPWITNLAIHEGRHAAQMLNGYRRVFRPFGYILGQIIPAFAAAYPGKLLLEGDAVVAETALTQSGRGRSGDFLNYYMYASQKGEYRDYIRWRVGSYYNYTPDHYAYGYLLLSGIQYRYSCGDFMAQYLDYVSRRPYDPWPLRHNMRRVSGKRFKKTLSEIMETHVSLWKGDTLCRAPFVNGCAISKQQSHKIEYFSQYGRTLWIKKDIYRTPYLVSIDSCARERRLLAVSGNIAKMNYCPLDSSLVWNEVHSHPRWGEVGKSVIRKYHIPQGKVETVTKGGNYIYPVEYGADTLAAIKYQPDASALIVLLDKKREEVGLIPVPSNLQPVQIAVLEKEIYSAAISGNGFGIWKAAFVPSSSQRHGRWTEVLPAKPVQISSLGVSGKNLTFASDRNGVWELYRYNIEKKELTQISSSLYGGQSFSLCDDGSLAYSSWCDNGTSAFVIARDSLFNRKVSWDNYYRYPIADSLSRQALKQVRLFREQDLQHEADSVSVSEKKNSRYRKFPNAFRFHSWAPAYINIDALENLSFDNVSKAASLGAMAFFQNTLSSLYGYVGYKAAKRGEELGYKNDGSWAHSGHINLTYSGLYPIFEANVHINERRSREYFKKSADNDTIYVHGNGKLYINASLRAYVPWQWSNGVLNWGVIPSASVYYGSDVFLGKKMLKFSADLRSYVMRNTPSGAVYPRIGVGAQIGWADPLCYANLWSYLPGIAAGQGLKVSVTGQWLIAEDESLLSTYVLMLPRGLQDYGGFSRAYTGYKISADYAIPFYMGDWHILDMFYCTRGIVTPHLDLSFLSGGSLSSAGATFEMEFGSFFWVRTPVRVGVTYSYNFGSVFPSLSMPSPHYIGATFDISLPN